MPDYILIDYDNLELTDRRKGVLFIIEKVIKTLSKSDLTGINILIRLYGGWYDRQNLTRLGQNLSAEVTTNFPSTMTLADKINKVIVNVELAFSLVSSPTHHLLHTYRTRGFPTSIKANNPIKISGCHTHNCPITHVYEFINNGICKMCSNIQPSDILYRGEQKLIDTMLTSDLIFLSSSRNNVMIVSSDDDFWPGILTAINSGVKVIHIHTRNRTTNPLYLKTANSNYIQKQI